MGHDNVGSASPSCVGSDADVRKDRTMWSLADRVVKAISDVTVGTVIVLVHAVLADRTRSGRTPARM